MIEVDEHSADAGMITRCEAFLDSLDATRADQRTPAARTSSTLNIDHGSAAGPC